MHSVDDTNRMNCSSSPFPLSHADLPILPTHTPTTDAFPTGPLRHVADAGVLPRQLVPPLRPRTDPGEAGPRWHAPPLQLPPPCRRVLLALGLQGQTAFVSRFPPFSIRSPRAPLHHRSATRHSPAPFSHPFSRGSAVTGRGALRRGGTTQSHSHRPSPPGHYSCRITYRYRSYAGVARLRRSSNYSPNCVYIGPAINVCPRPRATFALFPSQQNRAFGPIWIDGGVVTFLPAVLVGLYSASHGVSDHAAPATLFSACAIAASILPMANFVMPALRFMKQRPSYAEIAKKASKPFVWGVVFYW